MKIGKITFRNEQCWLTILENNLKYLGTWHIVDKEFVKALKKKMPTKIELKYD